MCVNKRYVIGLLIFLTTTFSSVVWSAGGVDSSGGGGAYVCRDGSGQVTKSLMIDLWEVQNTPFSWPNGLGKTIKVNRLDETFEKQIESALEKLTTAAPYFSNLVREQLNFVRSSHNFLSPDISISLPEDLRGLRYFPHGCPAEGMQYFNQETMKLDISSEIFSKLETQSDVAAAWLHEAIYNVYRMSKPMGFQVSSELVRHMVGCLLSDEKECLVTKSMYPQEPAGREYFACESDEIKFSIYPADTSNSIDHPAKLSEWAVTVTEVNRIPLDQKYTMVFTFGDRQRYWRETIYGFSHFNISPFRNIWIELDTLFLGGFTNIPKDHIGVYFSSPLYGIWGPQGDINLAVPCSRHYK